VLPKGGDERQTQVTTEAPAPAVQDKK